MLLTIQLSVRMRHAIDRQNFMVIFPKIGRYSNKDRLGELPESRIG